MEKLDKLREQAKALKAQNPRLRARNLATELGISEA